MTLQGGVRSCAAAQKLKGRPAAQARQLQPQLQDSRPEGPAKPPDSPFLPVPPCNIHVPVLPTAPEVRAHSASWTAPGNDAYTFVRACMKRSQLVMHESHVSRSASTYWAEACRSLRSAMRASRAAAPTSPSAFLCHSARALPSSCCSASTTKEATSRVTCLVRSPNFPRACGVDPNSSEFYTSTGTMAAPGSMLKNCRQESAHQACHMMSRDYM